MTVAEVATRWCCLAFIDYFNELGNQSRTHDITTEYLDGEFLTLEEFRENVMEKIADPNFFVMCSYSRTAVGQTRFSGGHVAPLGGYDAENDRVLVHEVNTWRYPSVWVETEVIWKAIRTTTAVGSYRGVVLVRAVEKKEEK